MITRSTLAVVLIAAAAALWSAPVEGQRRVRIALQAGYAHAFDFGSGSVGGAVSVLVQRTDVVAVGGEAGHFGLGSHVWTVPFRNPTLGPTTLRERQERQFWFLAALARYSLPETWQANPYVIIGTGLYVLRETRTTRELLARRDATHLMSLGSSGDSGHPGMSAGLGLEWRPGGSSWSAAGEVRVHSILGAGEGLCPVAVASVGVTKRL
ncbi:MAG: hypothetical protein JSW51_05700 [Gemmatimonadota bacterium]|nr:MAG: hypothetical protein JSW51_05700 [Gemmatimonadota bacterium]